MIIDSYRQRQTGLIHLDKLAELDIGIIGAGSIGGWTALSLVKMGCKKVTVYDHDIVEEQNIGPQLYSPADIGKPKVEALASKILLLTDGQIAGKQIRVSSKTSGIEATLRQHALVIFAVDTIKARKDIFSVLKKGPFSLIDGRMEANEIQIYSVGSARPPSISQYEKTFFDEREETPAACSMRSVVYNCFVIAGLIADLVAHFANGEEVPFNLEVDLRNFALYGGLING